MKTIKIKEETHRKLSDTGKKGESFDQLINKLLENKNDKSNE